MALVSYSVIQVVCCGCRELGLGVPNGSTSYGGGRARGGARQRAPDGVGPTGEGALEGGGRVTVSPHERHHHSNPPDGALPNMGTQLGSM